MYTTTTVREELDSLNIDWDMVRIPIRPSDYVAGKATVPYPGG